jgi:hypothetical protein
VEVGGPWSEARQVKKKKKNPQKHKTVFEKQLKAKKTGSMAY